MRRGTPGPDAVARRAAIIATVVIRGVTELEERVADFEYFDGLGLARVAVSWLEGYHELYSEGDTNT